MKAKWNLFKNAKYALCGLVETFKSEMAFRLEVLFGSVAIVVSFFLNVDLQTQILLIAVIFLILAMECMNTAIENIIDLVTDDFHNLAKIAKDCASAAVFLCTLLAIFVWGLTLFRLFKQGQIWII